MSSLKTRKGPNRTSYATIQPKCMALQSVLCLPYSGFHRQSLCNTCNLSTVSCVGSLAIALLVQIYKEERRKCFAFAFKCFSTIFKCSKHLQSGWQKEADTAYTLLQGQETINLDTSGIYRGRISKLLSWHS